MKPSDPVFDYSTRRVLGESVLFGETRTGNLAFRPEKIFRAFNQLTNEPFEEGKDFLFTPGSKTLTLPAGSKIAAVPDSRLYPSPESAVFYPAPGANALSGACTPSGLIIFDGGVGSAFFEKHQVCFEYSTDDPLPRAPRAPEGRLPRSRAAKSLKLAFAGDSITFGCNSSKQMKFPPFLPPYPEQFADDLRKSGKQVELKNFAISGTGILNFLKNMPAWFGEFTPDLLVAAYGMNDFEMKSSDFADAVKEVLSEARKYNRNMEVILVCPMPGNFRWKHTAAGQDVVFTELLKRIAERDPSAAAADVNTFWKSVSRGKCFFDMTGNGVNHPNDYGHRIYAQVLAELF